MEVVVVEVDMMDLIVGLLEEVSQLSNILPFISTEVHMMHHNDVH